MAWCCLNKPADFTNVGIKTLKQLRLDVLQTSRVGTPTRGKNNKLDTKAVWLSNNNITSIRYFDVYLSRCLSNPLQITWLDLSFNKLTEVDECIQKFTKLSVLYLHGNNIAEYVEILKVVVLLPKLEILTIHGNPFCKTSLFRDSVAYLSEVVDISFLKDEDIPLESMNTDAQCKIKCSL